VILDRLRRRYSVTVTATEQKVPLRTSLAGPGKGHGRLVKQSGGHGQYAVVDIEVRPLEPGSGYQFVDRIVGGAIPRQFVTSVDKGLQQAMADGGKFGYPYVDIEVTVVDGKAHSVDSSDMAFASAAGLALREAAALAGEVLLEPVDDITIDVPDEFVGSIMSDLAGRRGRMTGSESLPGGRTRVAAVVPAAELARYAIDLRALSHGAAAFTRAPSGYEPMPARLVDKVTGKV
jgi:elongation factor G